MIGFTLNAISLRLHNCLLLKEAAEKERQFLTEQIFTETAYCLSLVVHTRWFPKMACKVNCSLWINGGVNFNRDFTIQNPIASRFHCKTIVLKKVFNKMLYNIKSTKSILLYPV